MKKILIIISFLLFTFTTNTYAKDIIDFDNRNIDVNYSRFNPGISDGSGGGFPIYRDIVKIGAPWILPDYIYVEEGGKKGYLYYSWSTPFNPDITGVIPFSWIAAHYTGYLY